MCPVRSVTYVSGRSRVRSGPEMMPTACPAKTWLKLIFFLPRQMRPQRVTTMVLSWKHPHQEQDLGA